MNTSFGKFSAAFLVAAAALGTAAPARAAAYVGAWDPTYGAPFTNLGWRGTVYFDLPASPGCGTNVADCLSALIADERANRLLRYEGHHETSDDTDLAIINWTTANLSGVTISNLQFDGGGAVQYIATTGPFPSAQPTPDNHHHS